MKLKELHACAWVENERINPDGIDFKGYIAGFEQARELARLELTRFDYGDDPAILDIDVRIGEMGEEEVK